MERDVGSVARAEDYRPSTFPLQEPATKTHATGAREDNLLRLEADASRRGVQKTIGKKGPP